MRREGKFVGIDGTVPEGQGIVMAHLNECHELLEMVRHSQPYNVHLFTQSLVAQGVNGRGGGRRVRRRRRWRILRFRLVIRGRRPGQRLDDVQVGE